MRLACCQIDIAWESKHANFATVHRWVAQSSLPKNTLLVLPEMFATGFSMNVAAIAEDAGGETEQFILSLAREFEIYVLGGLIARGKNGMGRNEAIVAAPGGKFVTRYCKMHPFTLAGESRHYERGESGVSFDWRGATVAPFICYDLRFPEIFRTGVRRGAEIFTVIANWPLPRDEHWVALLKARAIENQCYVAGVNRCGTDPKYTYPGRSLIVGPHGEVLASAGGEECMITADVDMPALRRYREDFPVLRDRRADLQ